MQKGICAFALAIILLLPVTAQAAMWEFGGFIDAEQSTSSVVPSPYFGGGFVSATLDDMTGDFAWFVSFGGLTGPAIAAHFHEAPSGATGGVVIDIGPSPTTGIGATSGAFIGSTTLDAGKIDAVTGGLSFGVGAETPWYINIHTPDNIPGEIRGQLWVTASPIPLPGAVWLMLSGVGLMFGLNRRA